MNSPSSSQIEPNVFDKKIRFDDFEVSWAGALPSIDGYCFGSEDGRLRIGTPGDYSDLPYPLVDSNEAINGIALSGKVYAASTRCEVVFHNPIPETDGGGISTYDGGAHGILATSAGGFVAPLGRGGLLRAPILNGKVRMFVNAFRDNSVNFYKLAHLHGDGTRDVIAAATRRDGISTFDLRSDINNGRPGSSRYYKAPGLDVVDLCSLGSSEWPFALAALGADGSIHLFRNILGEEEPMSFRLDDLVGSAYTILHSQGHIFLLTSKAFYTFPNLATQFLATCIGKSGNQVRKEELMAVDAYIARDEVLIITAEDFRIVSVAYIASESNSKSEMHGSGSTPNRIQADWVSLPGPAFAPERAA